MKKSFGSYAEVSSALTSVLTGEMYEITIADWGIEGFVKSISGLPVPEIAFHDVPFKNKNLKFTKIANTQGTLSVIFMSDDTSKVRAMIEEKVVAKIREGISETTILPEVVVKVYKNKTTIARSYTMLGCAPNGLADSLELTEADGAPSEITLNFDYTDYDLSIT